MKNMLGENENVSKNKPCHDFCLHSFYRKRSMMRRSLLPHSLSTAMSPLLVSFVLLFLMVLQTSSFPFKQATTKLGAENQYLSMFVQKRVLASFQVWAYAPTVPLALTRPYRHYYRKTSRANYTTSTCLLLNSHHQNKDDIHHHRMLQPRSRAFEATKNKNHIFSSSALQFNLRSNHSDRENSNSKGNGNATSNIRCNKSGTSIQKRVSKRKSKSRKKRGRIRNNQSSTFFSNRSKHYYTHNGKDKSSDDEDHEANYIIRSNPSANESKEVLSQKFDTHHVNNICHIHNSRDNNVNSRNAPTWLEQATADILDLSRIPMGQLTSDDIESITGLMANWAKNNKSNNNNNNNNTDFVSNNQKSQSSSSALQVETLLKRVVDDHNYGNNSVKVTTRMYTMAIDAWAKTGGKNAAERAHMIHSNMVEMYKQTGDDNIRPSTISYNAVLNAWSKSGCEEACHNAESILEEMLDSYYSARSTKSGIHSNKNVPLMNDPDTIERFEEMGTSDFDYDNIAIGDRNVKPDVVSFTSVIGKSCNFFTSVTFPML